MKSVLGHPFCWLFTAVALGAWGQILLKVGVQKVGAVTGNGLLWKLCNIFMQWEVIAGFGLYGVSSILWLMVISRWQLSYAYPMIALGYVFVVFLSYRYFHDPIPPLRILGLALICLGVTLVGLSSSKKQEHRVDAKPIPRAAATR